MRNENVIKVFFVLITIISFLFAVVEQFGLSCFRDGSVVSDDGVFHLVDGDIDCESGSSAYGS